MIKVTQTWIRPNLETPFFKVNDGMKAYIDHYTKLGKLSIQRVDDASGSLSVSLITVYANETAKEEYINDPEIIRLRESRNAHNAEHNIIEAEPVIEII
jgi:hypothetical protein